MGCQNITFRGGNDVKIDKEGENPSQNKINFRKLFKYRVDANSNANYISKTTHNQLIDACGDVHWQAI